MSADQLHLKVLCERPVARNDQSSDIDVAVDLITSRSVGTKAAKHSINLCIVVDRSGSMSGSKLEQAKSSSIDIYRSLGAGDLFTMLAFDEDVLVVANPQTPPGSVIERIQSLSADGVTNLSRGWYLGLSELQTYTTGKHINRLILLSDGLANRGEQKASVLGEESARARDQLDITTSTIGVGTDFQEDILAAIAHGSGGRFWFIGEARIEDIIKEEFSGALSVFLERPRIEVKLPAGVEIIRELNQLPKISNRYRIRPIKGNDRFCFALRLRVEPSKVMDDEVRIEAELFDGTDSITRTSAVLRLGSLEEYVTSPEDPAVAMIVQQFIAATSDERIAKEIDEGEVTGMLQMLQSQSDLMKELEAKLAGASAVSWEEQGELRRQHDARRLDELRMEIEENEALIVVGQLVDLMRGLALENEALHLLNMGRKMHVQRSVRNNASVKRGEMDDWAAGHLLELAASATERLEQDYPELRDDILTIRGKINERLAQFS